MAVCSNSGAEFAGRLGAGPIIDQTRLDFTKENARYDIIFYAVAKSSFQTCAGILNDGGIYISTLPVAPPSVSQSKRAVTVHDTTQRGT